MAGYAKKFIVQDATPLVLNEDYTSNVASGGYANIDITAPTGYIYKVLAFHFYAADPSGSTSGLHRCRVDKYDGTDRDLKITTGGSNTGTQLQYQYGDWVYADQAKYPSDAAARLLVMKNLIIDDTNGIRVEYFNNTDVTQTTDVRCRLMVQKIRVR